MTDRITAFFFSNILKHELVKAIVKRLLANAAGFTFELPPSRS